MKRTRSIWRSLKRTARRMATQALDANYYTSLSVLQQLLTVVREESFERSTPQKSDSEKVPKKFWLSRTEWCRWIAIYKRETDTLLAHWDDLPEDSRQKLVKTAESVLSSDPQLREPYPTDVLEFSRRIILAASFVWASFRSERQFASEVLDVIQESSHCILEKAEVFNYPNNVLELSERDSKAFLKSLENPPEPSEKLIALLATKP